MSADAPDADFVEGFDDASHGPGVWKYARASRVRVIVDAAPYFEIMQQAMIGAEQRILLIGWDFDSRIHLAFGRRWWQRGWRRDCPSRLGSFIPWLVRRNRKLEVRILKWSVGVLNFLTRGSMLLDVLRWAPHRRIDFKFDTAHPIACSHHQKIAVIDANLAVCGGIDMTSRRWDTPEHPVHSDRRRQPHGHDDGPWHDATMLLEGEVAAVLDALGRDRWVRAGGKPLAVLPPPETSAWPEGLEAHFTDVEVGIARTRPEYRGRREVREIEELFIAHIGRAKRFIYAESQYFASRAVAEAICRRMSEEDPPEILLVNPQSAEGWLEPLAMDTARAELLKAIGEVDRHGRFHLFTPWNGVTPIYVHAKIMIVDDEVLRIGSANLNNRSMGLDSECDLFIDCARPANEGCGEAIRKLRHSLLAEHCGLEEGEVAGLLERSGSMAGMISALGEGRSRRLRRFEPPKLDELGQAIGRSAILDPEKPDEIFEPFTKRRGLFRRGSLLHRAKQRFGRKRKAE